MRKEAVVTNVTTRLRKRTGPSTSYRIVGYMYPGDSGVVVDSKTTNGVIWYKWEGSGTWSCGTYLKITKDLEVKPDPPKEPDPLPPAVEEPVVPPEDIGSWDIGDSGFNPSLNGGDQSGGNTSFVPEGWEWYQKTTFDTRYPLNPVSDEVLAKNIAALKHNMDIGYTNKNDIYDNYQVDVSKGYLSSLQKKLYNSFNRNKVAFPDKELTKTFAYVFFTRPDLNILLRNGTDFILYDRQVNRDLKYAYIWKNNPWCLKSLVAGGNPHHKFLTLLSNEALSFEVGDVVIKTVEHGETYNGNKIVYGKSDQESNAAGEISIRYIDTVNLDIFKLHLIWTDYISKISKGIFLPKLEHVKNKILDYASSCYYFLCGPDGSTILYWQKLTGVFPVNTSENAFSWDSGTLLARPEINIKYMYSFKTSMDMYSLYEFNEAADSTYKYKNVYDGDLANKGKNAYVMTGSTLSHCPRVWETTDSEGNKIFRLIWIEN
jgi:hypothetical protein